MRIVGALLEKVFGLPLAEPGGPLFTVRRAEIGDREGVLTVLGDVRQPSAAAEIAATADLCGVRCDCGSVIHCWVAVDRLGVIVGVVAAIDSGRQISLVDLVTDVAWRRCGIGHALLATLVDFADARRVPIITLVRGTDVHGLSWLCDRDFAPAKFFDGRPAIEPNAFPSEPCTEGIALARPWPMGAVVRIAE